MTPITIVNRTKGSKEEMQEKRITCFGGRGDAIGALFVLPTAHFNRALRTGVILLGILMLMTGIPETLRGQGFGGTLGMGSAKTVGIKRRLPAAVNLNQKRITVEALSAIQTQPELVPVLRTKLTTMIQGDSRFIVDNKNPQTILRLTVTNAYIDQKNYSVGTGSSAQNCVAFVGKVEVSYQAIDASNQAPLDSENLVSVVSAEPNAETSWKDTGWKDILHRGGKGACGTEAKSSMHEAQDALVDGIVRQMGQRAAPTDEVITVKLPGRKLDSLSRLALAQRWGTLEEEADKMEKLPKPEDDAYRIYLIALAKEAQAYDMAREAAQREEGKRNDISEEQANADFQKAQHLLDDARKLYKDAIQAKPGEKEFQEPDARMERAIAVYATIARHKEEYQRFLAEQKKPAPTPVAAKPPQPSDHPVTPGAGITPLGQIVQFCEAGMPLESITDYINDKQFLKDAQDSSYKFNFRTDPLTLTTSCKDKAGAIQRAMRSRLNGVRMVGATITK
jgi:hypothetical protein